MPVRPRVTKRPVEMTGAVVPVGPAMRGNASKAHVWRLKSVGMETVEITSPAAVAPKTVAHAHAHREKCSTVRTTAAVRIGSVTIGVMMAPGVPITIARSWTTTAAIVARQSARARSVVMTDAVVSVDPASPVPNVKTARASSAKEIAQAKPAGMMDATAPAASATREISAALNLSASSV